DSLHHVDRNREGHTARAAGLRSDGRVDTDHFAVEIEERTAARAGVDGGIRLEKILDADCVAEADGPALTGRDDAVRQRLAQAVRAADGDDPLADTGAIAVAEHGRR